MSTQEQIWQSAAVDDDTFEHLVRLARLARDAAYAPYSGFTVGAALLTASGRIFTGGNVENASYGLSVCAERVAIWRAIAEGERDFLALAVVTGNAGSPCGACRQVMAEFALNMTVIIADQERVRTIRAVADLLPDAFTPADLLPQA